MLFLARVVAKQDAVQAGKTGEPDQVAPQEAELEELCRFFGALSSRDTERTVVRVFRVVITRASPDKGIGSSEIANMESINRLTVLHHLNRLAELGVVDKRGVRYFMRDIDEVLGDFEEHALESIRRARRIAREMERW